MPVSASTTIAHGLDRGQRRQRRPAEVGIAGRVDQVDVRIAGVVDRCAIAASMRMAAFLFDRIEVGHGRAALDRACRLDRAAGMQQGFEQDGFAGAGVTCEGHVADLFGRIGHGSRPSGCATTGECGRRVRFSAHRSHRLDPSPNRVKTQCAKTASGSRP